MSDISTNLILLPFPIAIMLDDDEATSVARVIIANNPHLSELELKSQLSVVKLVASRFPPHNDFSLQGWTGVSTAVECVSCGLPMSGCLLEPVTNECGHSMCRLCHEQRAVMEDDTVCPVDDCRQVNSLRVTTDPTISKTLLSAIVNIDSIQRGVAHQVGILFANCVEDMMQERLERQRSDYKIMEKEKIIHGLVQYNKGLEKGLFDIEINSDSDGSGDTISLNESAKQLITKVTKPTKKATANTITNNASSNKKKSGDNNPNNKRGPDTNNQEKQPNPKRFRLRKVSIETVYKRTPQQNSLSGTGVDSDDNTPEFEFN